MEAVGQAAVVTQLVRNTANLIHRIVHAQRRWLASISGSFENQNWPNFVQNGINLEEIQAFSLISVQTKNII